MTKPIHPKPLVQVEGQSTRIRRTKRELAIAAQRAEVEKLWAEARVVAEQRLARTSLAEIAKATRLLRKWGALPTAKPKKRATKAVRRIWPGS